MVWLFLYVASVFVANWAVQRFGVLLVGFGLGASAAVYAVFMWISFGSFDFLSGQIVSKAWMAVVAIIVYYVATRIKANIEYRKNYSITSFPE